MIELRFSSLLQAPPRVVWSAASTMDGVNAELGPWLRMTHPPELSSLLAQDVPLGEVLFHSWILLLGVLPLDRHALSLEALHARGFDERSSSWLQRQWIHQRRVEDEGGGSRVSDLLRFEPRVPLMAPMLRLIVTAIFRHRHRRLQRCYGALQA